jgi:hypothetical protein
MMFQRMFPPGWSHAPAKIGDVTTLANLEIVEQIRIMVQGEAKVATKAGPEDVRTFGE